MKILNVVSMSPGKRGPVELQLLEVGRLAVARGDRFACWFSAVAPDWYAGAMTEAGVALGVLGQDWTSAVIEACRQERPDIVHFHFGPHSGMREASRLGCAVVRTEHSFRPRRSLNGLRAVVRHWRTRQVDRFIAVSEFIARQTRTDFLVPARRVSVVLNATDTVRFRPRPGDKAALRKKLFGDRVSDDDVVLTIAAHVHPAKRQSMLVEALPTLLESSARLKVVIAGGGPERVAVQRLASDLKLDAHVLFLFGDNDVAEIYAASDVAVLPSTGEGLPGSAIEALASGLPLVATPNGGTPEVYEDGVSGLSVHDQSSAGLARALLPLVTDERLRATMGRAGRQRAEAKFAIRRPALETLRVYDEVVTAKAAHR